MPQTGLYSSLPDLIALRRAARELPLFSTPQRRSALLGLHHAHLRGRGIDFDQVRRYQPGDDVRNIDWRVTARMQEPYTKLYHEERERPIYLLTEQSQQLFLGTSRQLLSVLAAEACALMGWSALGHHDRVGGLIFGDTCFREIRPRRSQQGLLQLLHQLATANQQLGPDGHPPEAGNRASLVMALRRAREILRPGSLAIVICGERALDEQAEQQCQLLGRHTDLLLLPLADPLDHALPSAGLLPFTSPDGHSTLEIDTHNSALRLAYHQQALQRQQRWQQLSLRLGAPLLPLETSRPALEQLQQHLLPGRRP